MNKDYFHTLKTFFLWLGLSGFIQAAHTDTPGRRSVASVVNKREM